MVDIIQMLKANNKVQMEEGDLRRAPSRGNSATCDCPQWVQAHEAERPYATPRRAILRR